MTDLPLTEIIKLLPDYNPYDDCEGYYFDEARAQMAIDWIQSMLAVCLKRGSLRQSAY